MPRSASPDRRGRSRLLRFSAALLALLCIAGYALVQYVTSRLDVARCTVRAADGHGEDYRLEPRQAANAATIAAVASRHDLSERAVTIALATAMQESALRNIDHGDRDSLGLFQQRPSQGWGTADQIQDPVYAAEKFYEHLAKVPGYSRLPLTVAAQRVQRSGFPQAYAKHESQAVLLTAALTGRRAASFTCTTGTGQGAADTRAGSASEVRERLVREFGSGVLPDGGSSPAAAGGGGRRAAPESQVVIPPSGAQREWELAHWAVAHATELRIDRVAVRGHVWTAERSEAGWRRVGASTRAAGVGGSPVTLGLKSGQ
ncbi:hypothetical protein [Streptomyces sp. ODS28]|uniref:hypothetical protein n=1 Tax=Streptomyces sp. ODS28 TaxID=3136688 RepID=UPI0031EBD7DC